MGARYSISGRVFNGLCSGIIEYSLLFLILSLLVGKGTYLLSLYLLGTGLILKLFVAKSDLVFPGIVRFFVFIFIMIWLWGILPNQAATWESGSALIWFVCILFGIFQVKKSILFPIGLEKILGLLLVYFVLINCSAAVLYGENVSFRSGYKGLFKNIHFLSEYAVMLAPALVYKTIYSSVKGRFVYGISLMGDIGLILASLSRPGYISAICSVLVLMPFLTPRFRLSSLSLLSMVLAVIYWGNISRFRERIDDLILNITADERAPIWRDFFLMQGDSTTLQWLFGHGLGQFVLDFHERAMFSPRLLFLSPHNFFFEVLYSHGFLGFVMVSSIFCFLYQVLVQAIKREKNDLTRHQGLVLLATLTALILHCFFTMPFFSRDFLLPLSLVTGFILLYCQDVERNYPKVTLG